MFAQRSKALFVSVVWGGLWAVYLITYLIRAAVFAEGLDVLGAGIAIWLLFPHIVLVLLGVLCGAIGFFLNSNEFSLASGILYSVAAIAFLPYVLFVLPLVILAFMGYAHQKKMNATATTVALPK